MLIRVKEKGGLNKKNRKNKRGRSIEREREEQRGKRKGLESRLLDHHSSVEVGYGFYTIRSKLLIANDMYWIVL